MITFFMHGYTECKPWSLKCRQSGPRKRGNPEAQGMVVGGAPGRKADAWRADHVEDFEQWYANSRTLRRKLVNLIYIFQSSPLAAPWRTDQRAESGTGRRVRTTLWGDRRASGMIRCTVGGWRGVADVSEIRLSSKS